MDHFIACRNFSDYFRSCFAGYIYCFFKKIKKEQNNKIIGVILFAIFHECQIIKAQSTRSFLPFLFSCKIKLRQKNCQETELKVLLDDIHVMCLASIFEGIRHNIVNKISIGDHWIAQQKDWMSDFNYYTPIQRRRLGDLAYKAYSEILCFFKNASNCFESKDFNYN